MTTAPPTPIVTRRAQRLASQPYMRFETDFRSTSTAPKTTAKETSSQASPQYSSFRRALSIERSIHALDTPEYIHLSSDTAFPASSPALLPSASTTRFVYETGILGDEDPVNVYSSDDDSDAFSPTTHTRTKLASPSCVPRWTGNYRMASLNSIEEDGLEEDNFEDGCPPLSSSPRSSDPLFPVNDQDSSPRTSDYDPDSPAAHISTSKAANNETGSSLAHISPSKAPNNKPDSPVAHILTHQATNGKTFVPPVHNRLAARSQSDLDREIYRDIYATLESPGNVHLSDEQRFTSKLHSRLEILARQSSLDRDVYHAISSTLNDDEEYSNMLDIPDYPRSSTPISGLFDRRPLDERSISVTPDYPSSGTPTSNTFGPRITRSQSWTLSSSSSGIIKIRSCNSSTSPDFGSSTRSELVASASCSPGYSADIGTSPIRAPRATPKFRSSNSATPTQRVIGESYPSVAQAYTPAKRPYSAFQEEANDSSSHKRSKSFLRSLSFVSASRSKTTPTDTANLSRVPASLRKSLSLRSDASVPDGDQTPTSFSSDIGNDDFFPTAPNTPSHKPRAVDLNAAIPFHVPIIAPPPGYAPRLPRTEETSAKIRIGNFIARERRCRAADDLDRMSVSAITPVAAAVGDEEKAERTRWEYTLGLNAAIRIEVLQWILEVMPQKYMYHPWISTASGSRLSRSPSFAPDEMPDLVDQLLTSPETRFHAAYMFLRYFYILMGDNAERKRIEKLQQSAAAAEKSLPFDPATPPEGWSLVLWDCCLACLAISVKMHRDVLNPLAPVLSWEYEYLAPHKMVFEDLEIAQRDVLSAFEYCIGETPQPILDELWIALPSLRHLLQFKGGWNYTQKEVWKRLFDAVLEPDVLQFPISILTAAALVEALMATLVAKEEYDAPLDGLVQLTRRRLNNTKSEADTKATLREKRVINAENEIEGVVQDIQALVGISDEGLRASRRWIHAAASRN